MSDTISLGFKLTGEADMKRGLADINNALKLNTSEMGLVTAKYDENGKSTEALNAKNKNLQQGIELQKQKISDLKAAIESASAAHLSARTNIEKLKNELSAASQKMQEMKGSSDTTKAELLAQQNVVKNLTKELNSAEKAYTNTGKNTTAWGTELNKAQTNIIGMNKELKTNEESLDKTQKGSKSLADAVNSIANAAGINVPPALQGMVSKLEGVNAGAAALTVVVAGLVAGLGKLTVDTAKSSDEIDVLSKTSGLTTDQIQEMNYSSELLDVNTETITGSITKMEKAMNSSKDKTSDQAKAFKELHVATTDSHGSLLDINTVFLKSIDALGNVKNETERDVLAMTIFGKSAKELNPLIEAGSGRMKELAQAAHDTGNVMSTDTLKGFTDLDDSMKQMDEQFKAVKLQLAQILLPVLKTLAEILSQIPTPVLTVITVIGGISLVAIAATGAIVSLVAGLGALSEAAAAAGVSIGILVPEIGLVVLAIAAVVGIAVLIKQNWSSISEFFSNLWAEIGDTFNSAGAKINQTAQTMSGGVKGWFDFALDGIKDGWDGTANYFERLWQGINDVFSSAAKAIYNVMMAPINAINDMIQNVGKNIDGLVQRMKSLSINSIGSSISSSLNIKIPKYATGTTNHPGGLALVGENGPEVVNLPSGSKVYPNGVNPSGTNYTFTGPIIIDAKNVKEFNDILKYAKQAGQFKVMGAN